MKNIYLPLLLLATISTSYTLKAQNVGIGEAAPSTKLEIKGDGSDLLNIKDNLSNSKLYIQSDGDIGVNTSSPSAMFHLYRGSLGGNTGVTDVLRIELNRSDHGNVPSGPSILFKDQDGNNPTNEARIKMMTVNDTDFGDNDEGASNFIFETTDNGLASDKMIITGRGNIGIGTINPSALLHTLGEGRFETSNGLIQITPTGWRSSTRSTLKIQTKTDNPAELDMGHTDGGTEYGWHFSARGSTENRDFRIYSRENSTFNHYLTIQYDDGDIGIGTTNPQAQLHTTGSVRFANYTNGFLQVDGNGDISSVATIPAGSIDEDDPSWDGTANTTGDIGRTGSVGVGINSPENQLHIYRSESGAVSLLKLTKNEGDISAASQINMDFEFTDGNANGTPQARIGAQANTDLSLGSGTEAEGTADMIFYTASAAGASTNNLAERMRIKATGDLQFANYSNGYLQVDGSGNMTTISTIPAGSITEDDPTWNGTANTTASVGRTGNVGIGKSSPGTVLDIEGNVAYPINITRTGNNGDVGIEFHDTDANAQTGYFTFEHANGDSKDYGASFHLKSTETLGVILEGEGGYYAGSNVAIRSDGNSFLTGGNLGLGTTGPSQRLDVTGNIAFTGGLVSRGANYTSTWMTFDEDNFGNSVIIGGGGLTAVGAGESAGQIRANVGAGTEILHFGSDNGMQFYTSLQSGWASRVNAMEISSAGDVAIGGGTSSSYKLRVYGKVRSDGINETSDGRLKKNVKSVENALDKVMALRGVNYEWRRDEFPDKEFEEGVELGVIAQEIEQILPEVVDTDNEGYKSVQYSHIVPVLIEAIKEQQILISELKDENSNLTSQVEHYNELFEKLDIERLVQEFGNQNYTSKNKL